MLLDRSYSGPLRWGPARLWKSQLPILMLWRSLDSYEWGVIRGFKWEVNSLSVSRDITGSCVLQTVHLRESSQPGGPEAMKQRGR